MNSKKLFLVVNVDWFFLSHRLPIALAAKAIGYDVTVLAIEEAGRGDEIRSYGLKFIALPSKRGGTNIIEDMKLLYFLYRIYKKEQPDIIHHVAIKPVIYGSIATKFLNVPKVINAVSGFGSMFISERQWSLKLVLIKALYRFSFSDQRLLFIVQNSDDYALLSELTGCPPSNIYLIKGSGVDLRQFDCTPEPVSGPIKVVLISRMLWDKGIGEFEQAARQLTVKFGNKVLFILAGKVDEENSSSISERQLNEWNQQGHINWIGFQQDVIALNKESHIAVLPSYREGLPKSLLEAMAIGRPVVTTDVAGCREVVKHEESGLLVVARDVYSLTKAIERLILDKDLRQSMGRCAREYAHDFSIEMVIEKTLSLYKKD